MTTLARIDDALATVPADQPELGLILPDDLTVERWEAIGWALTRADMVIQWRLADWYVFGETMFDPDEPGRANRAAALIGVDAQTLKNYAVVARKFPPERRRADLSWSHHRVVSTLEVAEQDRLLDLAASEGWSTRRLEHELAPSAEPETGGTRAGTGHPSGGGPAAAQPERVKPDAVTPAASPAAPAPTPPPAPRDAGAALPDRVEWHVTIDAPDRYADEVSAAIQAFADQLLADVPDVLVVRNDDPFPSTTRVPS